MIDFPNLRDGTLFADFVSEGRSEAALRESEFTEQWIFACSGPAVLNDGASKMGFFNAHIYALGHTVRETWIFYRISTPDGPVFLWFCPECAPKLETFLWSRRLAKEWTVE